MPQLDRNLRALATCYRIAAGVLGLGVTLISLMMMSSLIFGLLVLSVGGAIFYQLIEIATALEHHERRTFCLVVAWLVCVFFPLGTVLGVFTALQLIQPEAVRAFSDAEQRDEAPEGLRPGHSEQ